MPEDQVVDLLLVMHGVIIEVGSGTLNPIYCFG